MVPENEAAIKSTQGRNQKRNSEEMIGIGVEIGIETVGMIEIEETVIGKIGIVVAVIGIEVVDHETTEIVVVEIEIDGVIVIEMIDETGSVLQIILVASACNVLILTSDGLQNPRRDRDGERYDQYEDDDRYNYNPDNPYVGERTVSSDSVQSFYSQVNNWNRLTVL